MSVAFFLTSLIVVVAPGAGVLYTLSAGLSRGARASVVAALGCTLGILPHMMAAITGLASLLYASSVAFEALKILGVVYLLYMAWNTLKETGALNIETRPAPGSALRIVLRGILVNVLNPKLSLFFFAFLPQFVDAGAPNALPQMLELSFVFMLTTFVVFTFYGIFAASVRSHIVSRPRVLAWMRRSFAAVFVLLGARLAFAER
jgi:threonine/homoserine/homoserine lactone efflux protein